MRCGGWLAPGLMVWMALSLAAMAQDTNRGGRVEWARLKLDSPHWNRHSQKEYVLISFIRQNTSFALDSQWHAADIHDLNQLSAYPFLFSEGIQAIRTPEEKNNLREYLLRGGFLMIDACINTREVNPDPDQFFENQKTLFRELLPEAVIVPFDPEDPIYSAYFKMAKHPPHSYMNSIYDPAWAKHPLYRVMLKDRLVAVISLSGLKCAWSGLQTEPGLARASMEMLVNIYLYALMQ